MKKLFLLLTIVGMFTMACEDDDVNKPIYNPTETPDDGNDEETPVDKTQPINFIDNTVKTICITNWDTNGDAELSYDEAAAVTDIGTVFKESSISEFDELMFFISLVKINDRAFQSCHGLTSITIPGSVVEIGDAAFENCYYLRSIIIPNNVKMIGSLAFDGCSGIISVTIGNSVTSIGHEAFRDCIGELVINGKIMETDYSGFVHPSKNGGWLYGSSFNHIIIGDNIKKIGSNIFYDYKSLVSINIGNSVTEIREQAFYGCSNLTSVTIPDSVTEIGYCAFASCNNLQEFNGKYSSDGGRCMIIDDVIIAYANASGNDYTIPDSVKTIGAGAFFGCSSLTSVIIPDSVTSIEQSAFSSSSSLTKVTLGNGIESIGEWAFSAGRSLKEFNGKFASDDGRCLIIDNTLVVYANASGTSYTIPSSVTTIGNWAFCFCYSLTSVTIPDSVTTIGGGAFYSCRNLKEVYCKATTPPALGNSQVFDDNASDRKIYVPAGSGDIYKTAEHWSDYAEYIEEYEF